MASRELPPLMVEERRGARHLTRKPAADALVASYERCIATSVSMTHSDAHIDESYKVIARSGALLFRAATNAARLLPHPRGPNPRAVMAVGKVQPNNVLLPPAYYLFELT